MNKIINIKNTLVTIIAVSLISCNTSNNSTSKNTSENPFKTQVDSILNLMTLDEKIGQLNLPATGPITTGSSKSTDVVKKIEAVGSGSGQTSMKVVIANSGQLG